MDCPKCECDAGLLCEKPDMQQPVREWGVLMFCVHLPIMAMLVVLRQLGGEFFDFRSEHSRVDCGTATRFALFIVPSIVQMLLYQCLEPLYLYSCLLAFGQFIMWVSFIASFLILSRHLLPGDDNLFVLAVVFIVMGWMLLPWCYDNINHSSFSKKNSWTGSWITRHRVGYRLWCCACARGITKLCNLCKHRQDHAALCARNTLATIQYTEDNLVYNAPWNTRGGEVPEAVKRLRAMRFKPDFFDHRREFSRNDKKQIISCCSVTKLMGSVCCYSGEQT